MHSWGWALSEVSCLSGVDYGRRHNESRLGAGDGVAVGGGAKPSPASGVREEHQLYYLYSSIQDKKSLPISQICKEKNVKNFFFLFYNVLTRKQAKWI